MRLKLNKLNWGGCSSAIHESADQAPVKQALVGAVDSPEGQMFH